MQPAQKQPRIVHSAPASHREHHNEQYYFLGAMIGAHFVVMFALMYLMVNTWADVFLNVNNLYMSGAMAAPMAALMLLFMKSMYSDPRINVTVYAISAILLVGFIWFTRQQTFVGNEQFLKSMIPHHSGAFFPSKISALDPHQVSSPFLHG